MQKGVLNVVYLEFIKKQNRLCVRRVCKLKTIFPQVELRDEF